MKAQGIARQNLLHIAKRRLINAQEVNSLLKTMPENQRKLGSLPYDFLERFPKSARTEITKNVADVFENFSKEATEAEDSNDMYVYAIKNPAEKMVEKLKEILKRDDIKTSYVDSGSFKNCQKLVVGDYAYALSTFKKYPIYDARGYFREAHGKGNEAQAIFTAYKRFSQGRVCRPFLSSLSGEHEEGGFILSKFIDSLHPKKVERGKFAQSRDALKNIDTLGNSIQGIFIEAGGFVYNKKHIQNPEVRKGWKELAYCMDRNIELLNSPIANEVQGLLVMGIDGGLDICDKDILNSIIENEPIHRQKIARKLVKNIERARTIKNEAIKNGTYDKIKQLLKEDLCEFYPYEKYSPEFSEKHDIDDIYEGYPRLMAYELQINNVPKLLDMLELMEDSYCMVDMNLTKFYTLKDAMAIFSGDISKIKDWESFKIMAKTFNLEHRLS